MRHTVRSPYVALVALLAGCDFFSAWLGPGSGPCDACGAPAASPFMPYMLRGVTIRIAANSATLTNQPADTGNTLASWSLPDTMVASIADGSSGTHAALAKSVPLRGNAPGQVVMTITFPGQSWVQKNTITVTDSSAITTILLSRSFPTDTLRVGAQATFAVFLQDAAFNTYTAQPESLYVGDTSLVTVTRRVHRDRRLELLIEGKKAGKTNFVAMFRGIAATREIIVVP